MNILRCFFPIKCFRQRKKEESAGSGLNLAGCSVSVKMKRTARVKNCETNSVFTVFIKSMNLHNGFNFFLIVAFSFLFPYLHKNKAIKTQWLATTPVLTDLSSVNLQFHCIRPSASVSPPRPSLQTCMLNQHSNRLPLWKKEAGDIGTSCSFKKKKKISESCEQRLQLNWFRNIPSAILCYFTALSLLVHKTHYNLFML